MPSYPASWGVVMALKRFYRLQEKLGEQSRCTVDGLLINGAPRDKAEYYARQAERYHPPADGDGRIPDWVPWDGILLNRVYLALSEVDDDARHEDLLIEAAAVLLAMWVDSRRRRGYLTPWFVAGIRPPEGADLEELRERIEATMSGRLTAILDPGPQVHSPGPPPSDNEPAIGVAEFTSGGGLPVRALAPEGGDEDAVSAQP